MSEGNIDAVSIGRSDGTVWLNVEDFRQEGPEGLWFVNLTLDEARYLRDDIAGAIEQAELRSGVVVASGGDE